MVRRAPRTGGFFQPNSGGTTLLGKPNARYADSTVESQMILAEG